MPDSSGFRHHFPETGIPEPVQGAGKGIRRSAFGTVEAAGIHHGTAFRTHDAVPVFPSLAEMEHGPHARAAQNGQENHHPGIQEGIRHQVLRPGMVRMMHEGFRPYGILLHVGKLAHISFPHVPQRPRGQPLLYGIGFSHDRMCIRCSHYRQDSPTVSVKKACVIHRKATVRKHGEKSQPLPENSGGGRKPHFS